MKLFGPVLWFDLIRQARRPRPFMLRVVYALILLAVLWTVAGNAFGRWDGSAPARSLAYFAQHFVEAFMTLQSIVIVVMTPAYVGGAIAEEKERKTLEFILTTPLTNGELVFGKLASRLSQLVLLLLTPLPILSLLQLFGGVDPTLLWGGFGLSFLGLMSISSIAIWQSVIARKASEAIMGTYFYLFALPFSYGVVLFVLERRFGVRIAYPMLVGVTTAVAGTLFFITLSVAQVRRKFVQQAYDKPVSFFYWLGRLVRRLKQPAARPSKRQGHVQEAPTAALGSKSPHRAHTARRPPVSDAPVLWKELYLGRRTGPVRPAFLLMAVAVLTAGGWWLRWWYRGSDEGVNIVFRMASTVFAFVAVLAPAVHASSSIWSERDKQTLDGLLVTRLSPKEIIWGKWLGSLLNPRFVYCLLGCLWIAGVFTGGLHWLALPALGLAVAIYATFMTSFGIWVALLVRSSAQAQVWTMAGSMFFLGGGMSLFCCCGPFLMHSRSGPGPESFFVGLSPVVVLVGAAFSGRDLEHLDQAASGTAVMITAILINLTFYSGGAVLLWQLAQARFRNQCGRIERGIRPRLGPPGTG